MRKIISFLIITALLLSLLLCFNISTAAAAATLTTDKDVYVVGEPIKVIAKSDNASGKDWIGISPLGFNYAMRWEYLSTIGSGVQFDIRTCSQISNTSETAEYKNFPAGIYMISFMAEDDYFIGNKVLARKTITILDEALPKSATNVKFTPTESTSSFPDGNFTISLPTDHNATHIRLFWANENGKKLSDNLYITAEIPSYVTNEFIYTLSADTEIPKEAKKLLIYTYSDIYGLSKEFCAYTLPEINIAPDFTELDTQKETNNNTLNGGYYINGYTDTTSQYFDTESDYIIEKGCRSSVSACAGLALISSLILFIAVSLRKKRELD